MSCKEVVTFWLDMGAPISLLPLSMLVGSIAVPRSHGQSSASVVATRRHASGGARARYAAAMTFEYEEKPSRSRFVDIVWRTHDTSDGTYLAAADACWDMIFIRSDHGNRALLSGPSTQITPVPYRAGNRNVGIRFHRGSFLTHVPTTAMVDTTEALPMPTPESFLLAGTEWPMPSLRDGR